MKQTNTGEQMPCQRIAFWVTIVLSCICVADTVRYAVLGNGMAFLTEAIVNALFLLCALGAMVGKVYPMYLLITAASAVLFSFTNNLETTLFNAHFAVEAGISALGGIAGTALQWKEKVYPSRKVCPFAAAMLAILLFVGGCWGIGTAQDRAKSAASSNLWAVPELYDGKESAQPGTLEQISYETKAYATDERTVTKKAWVYLPYGYDDTKQYNILYLLHGTGDDEAYWLKKYTYNKTMVDNMIANGDIAPLIIVTPTFYVEEDCMENLDPLTYSFREELRNDLMPAVESKYATYAQSADDAGFFASREHRAFAGLSRGAVTTLHSVLCGSLDYFAWFGTFSASRTPLEYYTAANQTGEAANLPIKYWYVAGGNFDFGLVSQIQDYHAIQKNEPRLVPGENTAFDVFPMRYHSMGNWHLALYNFLQKIF